MGYASHSIVTTQDQNQNISGSGDLRPCEALEDLGSRQLSSAVWSLLELHQPPGSRRQLDLRMEIWFEVSWDSMIGKFKCKKNCNKSVRSWFGAIRECVSIFLLLYSKPHGQILAKTIDFTGSGWHFGGCVSAESVFSGTDFVGTVVSPVSLLDSLTLIAGSIFKLRCWREWTLTESVYQQTCTAELIDAARWFWRYQYLNLHEE